MLSIFDSEMMIRSRSGSRKSIFLIALAQEMELGNDSEHPESNVVKVFYYVEFFVNNELDVELIG